MAGLDSLIIPEPSTFVPERNKKAATLGAAAFVSVSLEGRLYSRAAPAKSARDQRDDEQDDGDDGHELGDFEREVGDPAEAENGGDKRDNQENDGPADHGPRGGR